MYTFISAFQGCSAKDCRYNVLLVLNIIKSYTCVSSGYIFKTTSSIDLYKLGMQLVLILDVASNDLTSKPNTKKLFTPLKHSKQDSASVAPLHKHNSVHQDDPTKATILNEQFQSVLSRKSPNSLSSLCHTKLQESTDADRYMIDITVTSKGIEKLLSNLNPHKVAGPDQIKSS